MSKEESEMEAAVIVILVVLIIILVVMYQNGGRAKAMLSKIFSRPEVMLPMDEASSAPIGQAKGSKNHYMIYQLSPEQYLFVCMATGQKIKVDGVIENGAKMEDISRLQDGAESTIYFY